MLLIPPAERRNREKFTDDHSAACHQFADWARLDGVNRQVKDKALPMIGKRSRKIAGGLENESMVTVSIVTVPATQALVNQQRQFQLQR